MSEYDGIDYKNIAYASGLTALTRFDFGGDTVADVNIARTVVAEYERQLSALGYVRLTAEEMGEIVQTVDLLRPIMEKMGKKGRKP